MSVFTNPASGAREAGEAYTRAVLELVADADPMEVLASTAAWLREHTADLSDEEIHREEAPGKWSVAHVLRHLADSEVVWGWRLRRVLAEDRPELTGYDQDAWAERLGYAGASREESLMVFGVLRESHLELLRDCTDEELERVGVHVERGEESVRHMIRLYAGHDLLHRRQIERVVASVRG